MRHTLIVIAFGSFRVEVLKRHYIESGRNAPVGKGTS